MIKKLYGWRVIILILAPILMLSCAIPLSLQKALTPTPTSAAAISIGGGTVQNGVGGGAGNGQGGSGGSGGNGGSGGSGNGSSGSNSGTSSNANGPYVVKQIVSLGKETISGQVCNLTQPFIVSAVAPEVSWSFIYTPNSSTQGSWVYSYFIQRAGESHNAAGSYTISQVSSDGTLLLTMSGTDNVAFKGFAGPFPVKYKFNLVPSPNTTCPNTP